MTGPYANAAQLYRDAGWLGVLPIVGKRVPPSGYTGYNATWPTDVVVTDWINVRGHENIGLRVPDDIIGIDVDAYDGRKGLETIEWYESQLDCVLPLTHRSSARDDGSGIRFFRVPPGMNWKSDLGTNSNVEIIRSGHRFAMVWPSIHPDIEREYKWLAPDNTALDDIPGIGEFPSLPDAWIEALQVVGGIRGPGGGGGGGGGGEDHSDEDAPLTGQDGSVINVDAMYEHGLPEGEQNKMLFDYMCSMRARNFRRVEMINAGMLLLQRMPNRPGEEPWTADDIINMVNRVRRTYSPGLSTAVTQGLGPGALAWAQRLASGQAVTEVSELPPREALATDMGNSMRMVQLLGDRIRYSVDENQWYVWDDVRWAPDRKNTVMDLTKNVIDAIRGDALNAEGDERTRWLNWARDSENLSRRNAMIAGAQAEPQLVMNTTDLDTNSDILVVRNGTLDLITGELRASQREDLCSHMAEVEYREDATYERWLGHVRFLCNEDPILMAYLQRAAGYSLTGNVGARSFFFMEGTGSNGKNAFIEPLMMVMGSYAKAATTALLTGGDEQHPTILADLQGSRLVFIDETRQGKALNVERLKALTGSKRVKARKMKKDFYEFDAQFKLWIAGNGQPTIRDPSDGVWNRMHRIMCHGKIAPGKAIDRFGDLLYAEEASGILRWALEGLKGWRSLGGLGIPDSIKEDVQSYRDEEDYVGQFIDDVFIKTGNLDDRIMSSDIFIEYERWAAAHGLKGMDKLNAVMLGRALSSHGIYRSKNAITFPSGKHRGFQGIQWANGTAAWLQSFGS